MTDLFIIDEKTGEFVNLSTVLTNAGGTPGTPAGGVMSVQGVAGGTAQPVSDADLIELIITSAIPQLPGALAAGGGLKVEGVAGGVAQPVSIATAPALVAGEAHVGEVGGRTQFANVEITLANPGAAYAINDAVLAAAGGLTELTSVSRIVAGTGYITGIQVSTNKKSITPRLRVHFFNASNPTVSADNANWQEKYADASKRVGYYDMPALTTAADAANSDMSRAQDFTMRIPFQCAAAATSLWIGLETLDAFTPDNGQKITVKIYTELN